MRFTAHDRLSAEISQFNRRSLPDDAFFTVIGHGARFPAMAIHLAKIGVESGVPDGLLIWRGTFYTAEWKTGTGTLRTAQRRTRDRMIAAGARFAVIHSLAEWIAQLEQWGIPLRAEPQMDGFGDSEIGL